MSEKFYDKIENICACDKFQFILDDYESERLAHVETKKRLEELEDAIGICLINHNPSNPNNRFESENIYIQATWGEEGFQEIIQAITNSRERQEENRLRTKVGEFIDRNGGEAMG